MLAIRPRAPRGRRKRRERRRHTPPPSCAGTAGHSGWIIQVGAFDGEREAQQKLSAVQAKASHMLGRADPFTEPVVKGDKTLYRARFAGLQKMKPRRFASN